MVLVVGEAQAQTTRDVFIDTTVATIRIQIAPDSLAQILAPENTQSDHEYPATMIFDNGLIKDTVEQVGFRLRGNTSREARKKSFKISINTFERGRKFYGLEKLNINGEHNDPSIIRSKLSWDLFKKMNLPSSRAHHLRLYINDQYYGLYIHVEHIDENFVANRFGGGKPGNLYKCLWPADLAYISDNPDDYKFVQDGRRTYELHINEEEDDYSDLAHFIDFLNNSNEATFIDDIEKYINVDAVLRWFAVDVLTGSWDDYWYLKNNYYLYYNRADGRFEPIPYDYDNTFGTDWVNGDWGTRDVYNFGHPSEPRPLATRLLAVDEYRDRFSYYIQYLIDHAFNPDSLYPRVDRIKTMITPAAEADTVRELDYGYTDQDFHDSYIQALGGHVEYGLKPYIETRRNTAEQQLVLHNILPVFRDVVVQPTVLSPGDAARFTIQLLDDQANAELTLYYRNGESWKQIPLTATMIAPNKDLQWFEGGIENLAAGTLRWYLAATDTEGATSRYPKGDGDYYEYPVREQVKEVVINEFLAGNDTGLTDENGDYEDWLELYNAGTKAVSLAGYYLTDRLDEPNHWALPDTTMQAGAFLLIWADDDEEDGPLHTNFKLSKDGESVGLFQDIDGTFIAMDTLRFGPQTDDISYGRRPDGGSEWVFYNPPTPGATNSSSTDLDRTISTIPQITRIIGNYPNPFNPTTEITYEIARTTDIGLSVFDLLGRRVELLVKGKKQPGTYRIQFDGGSLASGVYILRLEAGNATSTHRITLLK